ncbi:TIGR01212 family radical SAM protein [Peptoniphilus catoniae]|uniref:TIGR01212 family radical SAM protein n=1 Tax=Peptoniphilus catoniae TaxID=1660341 RepID=UPI0010FF1641|nr:TIGR01212 family radical SAM protein [Peptoniphilus catoniae]
MRRFLDFNTFFTNKFKAKVAKLSLNSGASCPNRDGTLSKGGCIFCSERGSGDFTSDYKDIDKQIYEQKNLLSKKWKAKYYIAYFQSFTNTYGDINKLRDLYNYVVSKEDIVGLSLATRADCLDDKVMEMLLELNKKTFLFLELGMQSVNENTIKFINRGYSHETFDENIKILKKNKIKFLTHLIFGLPCEDKGDILKSVNYIKDIHPFGVKFHCLYIQTDSPLYAYYKNKPFRLLSKDEYVNLVCDAIEILPKDIVIHRLTGDADKKKLIAPLWAADKLSVISSIDKELKNRGLDLVV